MLSQAYGAVMRWRNRRYDEGRAAVYRAPVPVISVGNLSTGGTGKTPMAEALLADLQAAGWARPAYLSRGYGRRTRGYRRVMTGQDTAREVGDEALQVARKFPDLPVAVCEDRAEGIRRLIGEAQAQLIVLDDAFQHRRVARDLDLVMIDANRLPVTDHLLPRGRLREPVDGLARAHLLVVNKVRDRENLPALRAALSPLGRPMAFCTPVATALQGLEGALPLSVLRGQRVFLFAGIGNPTFFARQVEALGAEVVGQRFFRDHHQYRALDLSRLSQAARQAQAWLLTTEKDYARLSGPFLPPGLPLFWIQIQLQWLEGEGHLHDALRKLPPPPAP
jgi:tetraacyldisaccharide 4'-kinase